MSHTSRQTVNTSNVLSVIMGGGQGTRLFPLTKERSKPAVPLAGKYRLVDIPISNCINSGLRRIYLLTQFNSASLHRHISQSYKFDHFSGGFVEILAARADLRRHLVVSGHGRCRPQEHDSFHESRMGLPAHPERGPALPDGLSPHHQPARGNQRRHHRGDHPGRARSDAQSLGIMQIDAERRITRFVEKPKDPAMLDPLKLLAASGMPRWGSRARANLFLASMGIYVFNRDVIRRLLDNTLTDFGKHIIPNAIQNLRVFSFMSSRATGRTSGPFAPSSRPTSTSPTSCRASTSSTWPRRSSAARAFCPARRSTAPRSITR